MIIRLQDALNVGGPALWVIFGISVVLLTVGLWKFWHFIKLGAWNRKQAEEILRLWLEKKVEPVDIDPGGLFINVGERTNVTGSAKFRKLIEAEKFDEAIQTYVRRKFGVVIGESTAELIKLQVGCATLNCKKEFEAMYGTEKQLLQKTLTSEYKEELNKTSSQ